MYGGLAVIIAITIIGIGISTIPQADAQTMTNATMPNAVDDNATSNGIDTLVIDVTANDELAGALIERLVVVRQSGPSGLDVTTAANTHVIYEPSINDRLIANGTTAIYTYTLTLNVTDAMSNTRTETITADVNITFVFEAGLEAVDDIAATVQNKAVDIDVLVNDVYRGDTLPTVVEARAPNNGTVTLSGNTFTYTPNENYTGIDTFVYNLTDADGGIDNATVTIEINADVAPMAVDDNATSNKVDTLYINATANDMPPTALIASLDFGSLYANFTGVGTITHNDTHIIYQPSAQDRLLPDGTEINFQYTIHVPSLELGLTDSTTIEMITATVTITLDAGLEPIDAVDDAATTLPDTPVVIDVLANDIYDRDGVPVIPIILSHPEHGTLNFSTVNNTITYTPDAGYAGEDSFVYEIRDTANDNATVTVSVTALKLPDIDVAVVQGGMITIRPDIGENFTVTTATGATKGTIQDALLPGKQILYTAGENQSGIDIVTYMISDGAGNTGQGTVYIHISVQGNSDPTLGDIPPSIVQVQEQLSLQVMATDADDNDTVTYVIRNAPAGVTINSTTGLISWTPAESDVGDHTFAVVAQDDRGGFDSKDAAVIVTEAVTENHDPTAPDIQIAIGAGEPTAIIPDIRDQDGDDIYIISASGQTKGQVTSNLLQFGIVAYAPEAGETGIDTISYTVSDRRGGSATGTINVYIEDPTNNSPDLESIGSIQLEVPGTATFNASATDQDNEMLTYIMSGAPEGATINGDTGEFSWMVNETGDYTFTVIVYDDRGGFDTEPVAIVAGMADSNNTNPVAPDLDTAARQDSAKVIRLNPSDPEGNQPDIILATGATQGTIVADSLQFGFILYEPAAGVSGLDSIAYYVSDGEGGQAEGTVHVHIRQTGNNLPVLAPIGVQQVDVQNELTFNANGSDIDDDPLTYAIRNAPEGATIDSATGVFAWTPGTDDEGDHEFTVAVYDDAGTFASENIIVTVTDPSSLNQNPVAPNASRSVTADQTAAIVPVPSDPDGDTVRIIAVSGLDKGTIIAGSLEEGVVAYRPFAEELGTDDITYTVSDGKGGLATGTITITITEPLPEPPGGNMIREDTPTAMATTESGHQVLIWSGPPTEDRRLEIVVAVLNPDGNLVEHLNYDFTVTQNDTTVLNETDVHHHTGQGSRITTALMSNSPIDVTITLQGLGVGAAGTREAPRGETVSFDGVSGNAVIAAHTGGTIREDTPTAMANTTSGFQVLIWNGHPTEGQRLEIFMAVLNSDGTLVDHLNYDIMVTQNGTNVLDLEDVHHHSGQGSRITSALESSSPIDVTITLQGLGVGPLADRADPKDESVTFTGVQGTELTMPGSH